MQPRNKDVIVGEVESLLSSTMGEIKDFMAGVSAEQGKAIARIEVEMKNMSEDVQQLVRSVRGTNGGSSLQNRTSSLEYDVKAIQDQLREAVVLKTESTRGRWGLWIAISTALIAATSAIVVAYLK